MPKPDASRFRGFFKLERSGDLVTDPSSVDPFETLVTVVFIDITLPWPLLDTYGLPDESVIEMPAMGEKGNLEQLANKHNFPLQPV